MKRYLKYKDSGVKWIGEIPEHWEVLPIKRIAPLVKAKTEDKTLNYIALENIESYSGRLLSYNTSSPESDCNTFCVGDVLFNKLRPYLTKSIVAEFDGMCTSELLVLRTNQNNKFLNYVLLSPKLIDLINASTYGAKMPRANWTFIGGCNAPLPPLDEQQAIVAYLDEKVGKIDRYISEKEKEIVALDELKQATIANAVTRGLDPNAPLKDSGIKWIGNIPQHWEVRRIKSYFKNIAGCGFSIDLQGNTSGDYPFCKASDINGQDVLLTTAKNYVSKAVAESEKYNVIPVQSIVYSKIGEALKKNHRKITACECIVDNNCAALCIKESHRDDMDITFFYYITKSIDFSIFDNGGTIPCVNNQKLMSSYIPYPSVNEQKSIVEYLNTKTAKIDQMKDGIKSEIEKLKEYKQRLISDVVTGKVCVKGEK